jgi:serine/threonine-protein kinase
MTIDSIGRFRPIAELGHGGMADVFLAVAQGPAGFSKLQVIKRLRPNLAEDPEFMGMLVDEARLAARLNHPNVVQTTEIGESRNGYFIAMEYLDGQPLHRVLTRSKRQFPLSYVCAILSDVLSGLHYAHELLDYDGTPLNVVHRDVTPHNIFVTYDGSVKIVDFGIAKAAGRIQQTREGVIKGKVQYMAPEQAMGRPIDRRVDLFSVGVMLWESATKKRFWDSRAELEIFYQLGKGDYQPSPRAVAPDVDEELDRICRRALAVQPDERYATAQEFQNELEAYLKTKGRPSGREIGGAVAHLFADKRAETRAIIEQKLAELRSVPSSDFKPVAIASDSSAFSVTPSAGHESDPDVEPDTKTMAAADPPPAGARPSIDQRGTLRSVEYAAAPRAAGRGRRVNGAIGAMVALSAIAVVAIVMFRAPAKPAPSTASEGQAPPSTTAEPPLTATAAALTGATATATAATTATAEAAGTAEDRAPAATAAKDPHKPPVHYTPPPPPRPTTPQPTTSGRAKRPIDTDNPFANGSQ